MRTRFCKSKVKRLRKHWRALTSAWAVIAGLVVASYPINSSARDNVIDGFYVFRGDCMSVQNGNIAPILIPVIGALISGALKASGSALTAYGADADAKFAATVNFDRLSGNATCVHIVDGPVYTNQVAFDADATDILETIPLPWSLIIAAKEKQMMEANQDPRDARGNVRVSTKTALSTSGAFLAGRPRFFAELRVVPQSNNAGVAFKIRSIYFGESMEEGWFKRSTAKRLAITLALYASGKSMQDALNAGYTLEFTHLPVGTSAFFSDYTSNGKDSNGSWETPWLALEPGQSDKPTTLVAGLVETRAGSKVLSVVGTALSDSAADTAKGITDKLDSSKAAAADAEAKKAASDARTATATATVDAITKWSDAKTAHDKCLAAIQAQTSDIQSLKVDFVQKQVLAATALANAQPLASAVALDTDFLTNPGVCHL